MANGGKGSYNTTLELISDASFPEREREKEGRERMAPKVKSGKSTAAPAVTSSPRRTRSATAGKRVVPPPAKPPAKKQKVAKEKKAEKSADDVVPPASGAVADISSEAITIEACKQCNSFKIRANIVKEGLESAIPGIDVTINPEKPRRGCFEIRRASGEAFISLLDMKRPFTPMKNLDMDGVVEDIVKKLK